MYFHPEDRWQDANIFVCVTQLGVNNRSIITLLGQLSHAASKVYCRHGWILFACLRFLSFTFTLECTCCVLLLFLDGICDSVWHDFFMGLGF